MEGKPAAAARQQGVTVPEDVAALKAEFPAWEFNYAWIVVGSGPDVRTLFAWPPDGGRRLASVTADGLRQAIKKAGG